MSRSAVDRRAPRARPTPPATLAAPGSDAAGEATVLVRRLRRRDAAAYRALMLEAYAAHPEAFTATVPERQGLPLSWWEGRLGDREDADQAVYGAFDAENLRGVAGVSFHSRPKTAHKAKLFGMYVQPTARARGLGGRLVAAAVAHAARRPETLLMQLTVTDGNLAARRLYERCGFVAFGVEPHALRVDGGLVGKVHMWRWLRDPP